MARTILLDDPTELPAEHLPWVTTLIGACRFTYAKSVPDSPHEYCLRRWLPQERQPDYDRFISVIHDHGYRGRFQRAEYVYLNVNGWRYWETDELFGKGKVINRANNELAPATRQGKRPVALTAKYAQRSLEYRTCQRCGIRAAAVDEHQQSTLDAIGFVDYCPDCQGEPLPLDTRPVKASKDTITWIIATHDKRHAIVSRVAIAERSSRGLAGRQGSTERQPDE